MTVAVPNALSLGLIVDGSLMIASDVRNDFTAVQVGVNGLIAMFTNAPTKGDLIVSAGAGAFDKLGVGSNGQVVTADSTQPLGVKWSGGSYRKTTAKTVNTTVAATDLLNGEITIAAGQMGVDRTLRLTAWGDWLNNSGGGVAAPRFQLVLGGTTLLDTSTTGTVGTHANRTGWKIVCEIENAGSASAQTADLHLSIGLPGQAAGMATFFTVGNGLYEGTTFRATAVGSNSGLAVNTVLAQLLALNVINGSASASYETKLLGALVEIL